MNKKEAIALFGKTTTDLAKALGITPQAAGRWPDELSERQIREVIGAAVRLGVDGVNGLIGPSEQKAA